MFDQQLIVAARLIQAHAAAGDHRLAFARREATQAVASPEHRTAQLRIAVLEREIPVSGRWPRQVRYLALDPDLADARLEQLAHFAIELGNRINGMRRRGCAQRWARFHCDDGTAGELARRGGHVRILPPRRDAGAAAGLPYRRQGRTMARFFSKPRGSMRILEEALTFDDVLLVPARSDVLPREVDLSTQLTRKIRVGLPVLSAAIDTVTEARLAITMAQEGGIGIVHKNMSIETQG